MLSGVGHLAPDKSASVNQRSTHVKQKKNYTLLHAIERMKIYKREKFDYDVFEVTL